MPPKFNKEKAFEWWASLDPTERTTEKLAEHVGISPTRARQHMMREAPGNEGMTWHERARTMDRMAHENALARLLAEKDQATVEHIHAMRKLRAKALAALDDLPLLEMKDALKVLTESIKLERECLGLNAKEGTHNTLEVTLRQKYDDLLSMPGETTPGRIKVLGEDEAEPVVEAEEPTAALSAPADDEAEPTTPEPPEPTTPPRRASIFDLDTP